MAFVQSFLIEWECISDRRVTKWGKGHLKAAKFEELMDRLCPSRQANISLMSTYRLSWHLWPQRKTIGTGSFCDTLGSRDCFHLTEHVNLWRKHLDIRAHACMHTHNFSFSLPLHQTRRNKWSFSLSFLPTRSSSISFARDSLYRALKKRPSSTCRLIILLTRGHAFS